MRKLLYYVCMLFFIVCMPLLSNAQCTVSAGGNGEKCIYRSDSIQLIGSVTGNFTTYAWTTTGSGTLMLQNSIHPYYFYSAADIVNASVTFTLTASGGTCGTMTSQTTVKIYKRPTVVLPADFTVCGSQISLTSTVTGASTIQWIPMGATGTIAIPSAANTLYTASAADISRGYVMLWLRADAPISQCLHGDSIRVTVAASPTINAGVDEAVCTSGSNVVYHTATATGYSSYLWTTSGSGTFADPASLTSPYMLSAADIAAGSVTLTLTGINPACGNVSDSKTVTVFQTPVVSAGPDQNICGNTVALNGSVASASATTVHWMDVAASGSFSSSSALSTVYTVSSADITRGYALLTLSAITPQGCFNADTVRVSLLSVPTVYAGYNLESCSGAVQLSGYAYNVTSKLWTTSGTGTFSNATRDSAVYTPSAADITSGRVTLTYTGTNNCTSLSRTITLDFISSGTVQANAGPDESVCVSDTIRLNGTILNATSGSWITTGTGRFLFSTSYLGNLYVLSAADKSAGSVTFTLTSHTSGGCGMASDQKTVTINAVPKPVVHAGPDQVYGSFFVQLNASVSNATSQLWKTSGKGVFTPTPTSLTASYIPSDEDIAAESVVLTLTATGACGEASDHLTVFTAIPSSISGTVRAGSNTLDRGVVYLFAFDEIQTRKLVGIDSISPADNGVYVFANVPKGTYTIYAVPQSAVAVNYLATYYGSLQSMEWQYAEQKEINNGGVNILDISLAAYTSALPEWNTGKDTIAGIIYLNTAAPNMRLAGPNDVPLAGVVVFLRTLSNEVIAYTSTDKYGMYAFKKVLAGNYFIGTEYVFIGPNDKIVAVDGNAQTVEDGNKIVYRVQTTTGIATAKKPVTVTAYPNPTWDNVHIRLNKTGECFIKVLDETGTIHVEQSVTVQADAAADISLAGLHKGMYFIQITSGEDVYTAKVVKF